MNGVLNLMSAPGQVGSPAANAASMSGCASPEAPDNVTLAASQQGARLQGTSSLSDGSQAQVQILCRPVPARGADSCQSTAAPQQSSECGDFHFDTASLVDLVFKVAVQGMTIGLGHCQSDVCEPTLPSILLPRMVILVRGDRSACSWLDTSKVHQKSCKWIEGYSILQTDV